MVHSVQSKTDKPYPSLVQFKRSTGKLRPTLFSFSSSGYFFLAVCGEWHQTLHAEIRSNHFVMSPNFDVMNVIINLLLEKSIAKTFFNTNTLVVRHMLPLTLQVLITTIDAQ